MSLFTQTQFNTSSVSAMSSVDVEVTIPANYVDVYKLLVVPSIVSGTSEVEIYTNAARDAANLLYKTQEWDDAFFADPIEDQLGVYNYRNEGFVARYEDTDVTLKLHLTIYNNSADAKTYNVTLVTSPSPYAPSALGVPISLRAFALANGMDILTAVEAAINNIGITSGELRMKFYAAGSSYPGSVDMSTVAEGGSFADNGTTQRIITVSGDNTGAAYSFTSASAGRWYFAWRLQNASGWSNFTDGNEYPTDVTQFVETELNQDTGPPAGWKVTLEKAQATNYYIVRVSRPQTNGNLIMWWTAQIKDASVGAWRELDANTGAAVTKYDGSGTNHTFDPSTNTLTAPAGWGTAAVGDLVIYDVRGDTNWDLKYCLWNTIASIAGNDIHLYGGGGRLAILSTAHETGGIFDQIRLKIVKGPWEWTSEGYLGAQANNGLFNGQGLNGWPLIDRTTRQFVSEPIYVPSTVVSPQARVWFHNGYSRSDDDLTVSSAINGGHDIYDGFTWYSFTDRDWWIPALQQIDKISYELESAGTVKVGPAASYVSFASNVYGQGGMTGRFRVYPDSTGIVKVRGKWTVNLTADTSSTESWAVALLMDLESMFPLGVGADQAAHGIAFGRKVVAGTVCVQVGALRWTAYSSGSQINWFSNINYVINPAPSSPFVMEIRLTIDEDAVNIPGGAVVMKTYEYQVDGGGWNAVSPSVSDAYMYDLRVPNGGVFGFMPRLLYWQGDAVPNEYVRLTEFEVTNGILARE